MQQIASYNYKKVRLKLKISFLRCIMSYSVFKLQFTLLKGFNTIAANTSVLLCTGFLYCTYISVCTKGSHLGYILLTVQEARLFTLLLSKMPSASTTHTVTLARINSRYMFQLPCAFFMPTDIIAFRWPQLRSRGENEQNLINPYLTRKYR